MKKKNIFLAIISMILLFQIPANAITKIWVGTTDTDWNNGTNWSPAGVPVATDDVVIQSTAPATIKNCVLLTNVTCASVVKTGTTFKFVLGAFTMTVNGNITPSTGLGNFVFTMSAPSILIITGTILGANPVNLVNALGTVRFEGATNITIPTGQGNFGSMVVNKSAGASVSVDAANLGKFLDITLENGTLATGVPSGVIVLAKLNIAVGISNITVAGASNSQLRVTDVEVFGGTCTMDSSDNLAVSGNWTQSGTGTFINADATNGVIFTGAISRSVSGPANPINIQANVQILKTAPATVRVEQVCNIGTTVANKNLVVQTGTLVLAMGVNIPITVNGNINIIGTGVLNTASSQTIVALTGNFISTSTAPVPMIIALGSADSDVQFIGTTNSLIDVNSTTIFNNLTVNKVTAIVSVTPVAPTIIRIENNLNIGSGRFVAVNSTDAVTNVPAISAINNAFHRTAPKQIVPPSPISPLTINGLTGETINIPNPDIIVKKDVIIAGGASLDLGTNEPQANNAQTITLHIGKDLNDFNSQSPSNSNSMSTILANGASIVPVLDANNANYPLNVGPPRGLYIGLSTTRPMGTRSNCSNTNGEVPYAAGLSPRSNFEIPTIVFFSGLPALITGFAALPDLCNNFNQGSGLSLPNVIIYKTDVTPALSHTGSVGIATSRNVRINGNFTVVVGTFNMNSRLMLFGDYSGKDGATLADDLAEDDKLEVFGLFDMGVGSTLLMNTGAEERGTIIRVRKGGYFKTVGSAAAPNKITREGTPGQYYRFCVYNGGGIASFRTEHTFMSARSDDSAGLGDDANVQPSPANIGDPAPVTASPNYDLVAADSNIGAETGAGSGHGWIDSRGGLKVLWGAIVNPEGTSSPDPEFLSVDHNFSYATFGSGGPSGTSLTINTGQELDIYGSFFNTNSGSTSRNLVGNSRIYFNDATSTDPANINIITLKGTLGPIGGSAGEQFDGGKNDQDIAPLYDLIRWETYANIYWVGNYTGTTTAVPASAGFPPTIPATPFIAAQAFRSATGEGPGSPLEYVAGASTINETHSGSATDWNNPLNWSLSNRSYYNPYQIYPGQPTPNGYPKKINSANPFPGNPAFAFGAASSSVPSDTLEKFEVQITRTAPSNPTMNVPNLTVDGSIVVNSGVVKDLSVAQIRTANSRDASGVWTKRMTRADIIPQVTDAQQNVGTQKVLTITSPNILNIGGDLQVNVNGRVSAVGTSNIRIKGNIEAISNLVADNQQPPANGNPGSNSNNTNLNPTDILPAGNSPAFVIGMNQLDFDGNATLTLNGIGGQQIKAARNPLHHLVIDKPSGEVTVQGLTLDQRTALNMTGNFTLSGGKFTMLSTCPLVINGNAVLNSATSPTEFKFNSSSVTVRGNWTNTGATINSGTGVMNFHPITTAAKTIRSNGQTFPSLHFGFFDNRTNSNNNYHLSALPEDHPAGTPMNPGVGAPLVGATTYFVQDNLTATGLTTVYNNRTLSTLANTTVQLRLSGVKVLSGGTLDLQAGAELLIDPNPASPLFSANRIITNSNSPAGKTRTLLIEQGGTLLAVGTAGRFVKISRNGSSGFYRFIVEGTIQARFFLFEFMDFKGVDLSGLTSVADGAGPTNANAVNGANIIGTSGILGTTDGNGRGESIDITDPTLAPGATTIGSFSDGIFTFGENVLGAAYLRLPNNYTFSTFPLPVFPAPTIAIERTSFPFALIDTSFPFALLGRNVIRLEAPVPVNPIVTEFRFATGIFSGEDYDDEVNATVPGPNGHVNWIEATKRWDGRSTLGVVQTDDNWSNPLNWEGDAVPLPTEDVRIDFLAPNRDLNYNTGANIYIVNVNGAFTCKSLTIVAQTTPSVQTITLNVNAPLTINGAFSTTPNITTNVGSGVPISVSGDWSNNGVFNNGGGTVTFEPSLGSRVIKSSAPGQPNPFFNVVFANGTTELNSTLFLDNDLTIKPGATLRASAGNQTIDIQGDWLNEGTFEPNFGLVNFTGVQSQTITKNGAPGYENFWNLRIAKGILLPTPVVSVTNTVTLNSRVLVGPLVTIPGADPTRLSLLNGKFITTTGATPGTGSQMILSQETSWLRELGAPTQSAFVEGPLGRIYTSSTGAGSEFDFPVGKGTYYKGGTVSSSGQIKLRITLSPTAIAPTTFTMEQMGTDPEAFSPGTRTLPSGINVVSSTKWWDVKNIDFPTTFNSNLRLIEEGQITLPFSANEQVPTPATIFGVTYGNGGGETPLSAALIGQVNILQDSDAQDLTIARGVPNTAATTDQIRRGFAPQEGTTWRDLESTINDLTNPDEGIQSTANFTTLGNGQFTFGFFFLPLPVELLDLKAEVQGEKVRVSWITVSEKNNDYFIVEKSIDAKNFEEVGRVPAKTSTSALNNYEIFDANPYQAINYYRLKQFDKNGKFTYSKIISIKMGKNTANNLSIYPNPTTNNEFVVDLKGTDLAGAQVTVTDMLGKTVYSTKIEQNGSFQTIRPNITLANGMYIVTVQTNEKVYQQRLSVK